MLVISRVLMIPLPYMVKEPLLVVIARVATANNPNLQMRVLLGGWASFFADAALELSA